MENKHLKVGIPWPVALLLIAAFMGWLVWVLQEPQRAQKRFMDSLPEELKQSSEVLQGQFEEIFGKSAKISFVEPYQPCKKIGAYELFLIFSSTRGPQHLALPDGDFWGPFAFDGRTLLHLSSQNRNFERMLTEQHKPVPQMFPAEVFARMINDFKLDKQNTFRHIVKNAGEIRHFTSNLVGNGYEADQKELAKFENMIEPPQYEQKGEQVILTYFALRGWMHEAKDLVEVTAVVNKD